MRAIADQGFVLKTDEAFCFTGYNFFKIKKAEE